MLISEVVGLTPGLVKIFHDLSWIGIYSFSIPSWHLINWAPTKLSGSVLWWYKILVKIDSLYSRHSLSDPPPLECSSCSRPAGKRGVEGINTGNVRLYNRFTQHKCRYDTDIAFPILYSSIHLSPEMLQKITIEIG